MKKTQIINIGKSYGLNSKLIELILLKTTGLSRNQLFLIDDINDKYLNYLKESFQSVKKGVPIEYVIEKVSFYSLDFFVNKNVLIPRNDTEVMVSKAIDYIRNLKNNYTLIDVGTGSSCIPISIINNINNFPDYCYALDISALALEVARFNINKFKLNNIIKANESNLLSYFLKNNSDFLEVGSLIITANLPYIKDNDFANMDSETIKYEPHLALYGGKETGFEIYEELFFQIIELKNKYNISNIVVFIEIGFDQKFVSMNFFKNKKLDFKYFKDNSGIERCVMICL
ncbi:hypothetical protein CSB08_00400 [Candidatus Gracilibacteria bacterium]|nr:MAG: hypothetical protein CSB08_00400 [Candidatus Gracilibacteria bacterium]PIE85303.1 MAG: hypothetical protein CSA08_02750 [Candidatus Gracilibacteria bacterium]